MIHRRLLHTDCVVYMCVDDAVCVHTRIILLCVYICMQRSRCVFVRVGVGISPSLRDVVCVVCLRACVCVCTACV